MIAVAEKGRENQEPFMVMENVDKTAMMEISKVSSAIHFGSKYSWTIGNADMHTARELESTSIEKY